MTEAKAKGRLGYWIKLLLSIGLSALFLWLAVSSLAGCPDGGRCEAGQCIYEDPGHCGADASPCPTCVDWSDLPAQLGDVSILALVLFSLGFLAVHLIRVWRWIYLLRPLGLGRLRPAINAGFIGLAAIVIVPLRLGELVRPYLIARDTDIPMSAALGTAVVERVVDGLVVTLLLFITLFTVPTQGAYPAVVWTAGSISALVFSAVMTVLLLAWWQRETTIRVLRAIGYVVSRALTEKAIGLLEGFLDGVAALKSGGDLWRFLLSTALYWFLNAATLVYLANAFGLELSLVEGVAVMSMLVIGIMVPGGPGHVGTYEFFLKSGLSLYVAVEMMPGKVLAFIATLHVLQFLIQVLAGVPFWLADGLNLKRALEAGEEAEEGGEAPPEAVVDGSRGEG